MANAAALRNISQGRVTVPGSKEAVRWSFYDSLLYPLAGIPRLDFFQLPQGQGVTTAVGAPVGSPKTIHDTNMDLQGALPRFQDFQLESIEVRFYPGVSAVANTFTPAPLFVVHAAPVVIADVSDANDENLFRQSGALILSITSKDYLREAALDRFPGKTHYETRGFADGSGASTVAGADVDITGRPYFLDPFLVLLSNQNFMISLTWPALVPLPSGFNARVMCIMEGILYRNAQ